jgi:hypothetical protein
MSKFSPFSSAIEHCLFIVHDTLGEVFTYLYEVFDRKILPQEWYKNEIFRFNNWFSNDFAPFVYACSLSSSLLLLIYFLLYERSIRVIALFLTFLWFLTAAHTVLITAALMNGMMPMRSVVFLASMSVLMVFGCKLLI